MSSLTSGSHFLSGTHISAIYRHKKTSPIPPTSKPNISLSSHWSSLVQRWETDGLSCGIRTHKPISCSSFQGWSRLTVPGEEGGNRIEIWEGPNPPFDHKMYVSIRSLNNSSSWVAAPKPPNPKQSKTLVRPVLSFSQTWVQYKHCRVIPRNSIFSAPCLQRIFYLQINTCQSTDGGLAVFRWMKTLNIHFNL